MVNNAVFSLVRQSRSLKSARSLVWRVAQWPTMHCGQSEPIARCLLDTLSISGSNNFGIMGVSSVDLGFGQLRHLVAWCCTHGSAFSLPIVVSLACFIISFCIAKFMITEGWHSASGNPFLLNASIYHHHNNADLPLNASSACAPLGNFHL